MGHLKKSLTQPPRDLRSSLTETMERTETVERTASEEKTASEERTESVGKAESVERQCLWTG